MLNPIKRIHQFNHAADLVSAGYDDFLESSFQIEEALEGFFLEDIASNLRCAPSAREISRGIINECYGQKTVLSDVDRLDKACDAVVFAIGSMTKLDLTPQQITAALNVVMDANQVKLGCPKDSYGKLIKPANFPNPEPRLQAILDERASKE